VQAFDTACGHALQERIILVEEPHVTSAASTQISGAILAGGQSRRMGRNKALMSLGGVRLIDRVIQVMQDVCPQLFLVTNTPEDYADLGLPMAGDVWPDKGSLGGIYSALYHANTPHCLVVACDMPFLNAAALRYLIAHKAGYDVVIPEVEGEPQPLHAVYSQGCRAPIARRLEAHRLKITGFFPEVRVRTVTAEELRPFDPTLRTFQNLNTLEEFHAADREVSA
jgi:molybdopterin-guanine dinucleotide biosynthesis protein A